MINYLTKLDNSSGKLDILIGKNDDGISKIIDLSRIGHMMISGTTGSGKTNFLFNLICSLLYKHTNDIELLIVDLKQIDFIYFNGVKCCYKEKVITHNFQLEEMMMHLEEEYYTRKKLLSKNNFNTFKNIILIVDEYVELIYLIDKLGFRKRMEKLLKNISSHGQDLGIHLILASQCFRKEYLKSTIKKNINCKISFRVGSFYDSKIFIGKSGAEKLKAPGDMLFLYEEHLERIKCPFYKDTEILTFLQNYKS